MCKFCKSGKPLPSGMFNVHTQRDEIIEHIWAHIQEAADRGSFSTFKLAADDLPNFDCTLVCDPVRVLLTDTVTGREFEDFTILVGRGSITRRRSRNRVL